MIGSCLVVNEWFEGDVTLFVITCGVDNISLVITQLEAELTFFEGSFAKNFIESQNGFCRCSLFNRVIEDGVVGHGCVSYISTTFFVNRDKNGCFHVVIDDVFIRTFDFFNGVLVGSRLAVSNGVKADFTIFAIRFSVKNGTVSSFQLEGEFAFFKATTCKLFRQFKGDVGRTCDVFSFGVPFTINKSDTCVITLVFLIRSFVSDINVVGWVV